MSEPQALRDILSTYAFKLGAGEVWGVPSRSEPDVIRIVVFFENGTVVCSCPAKVSCRHIEQAQKQRRGMRLAEAGSVHTHDKELTYDELLAHVLKPHPMGDRIAELANVKSEVERWSKDQLEAVHDDWHSE